MGRSKRKLTEAYQQRVIHLVEQKFKKKLTKSENMKLERWITMLQNFNPNNLPPIHSAEYVGMYGELPPLQITEILDDVRICPWLNI